MNEIARAQIDSRVIAQIVVGNRVEEYQIAAAQIGDRCDLRVRVVVALIHRGTLQLDAQLLEAVAGEARAVIRGRAVCTVNVRLAQLILSNVNHVFQLRCVR